MNARARSQLRGLLFTFVLASSMFARRRIPFAIVRQPVQNQPMPANYPSYIQQHTALAQRVSTEVLPKVIEVGTLICQSFDRGGRLLTFGNGGSAADAIHLAEEMIGKFLRDRRSLPATALCADGPAMTCIANDYGYADVFYRQVQALARPGDVVFGITTSGNSENVLRGLHAGKEKAA